MYGTIATYRDLTEQYLNNKITFEKYSQLVKERSDKLKEQKELKDNIKRIDLINRKIITNI